MSVSSKIQFIPLEDMKFISNEQILATCKNALNGSLTDLNTIFDCEFKNNSGDFLRDMVDSSCIEYLAMLKSGKSFVEIIENGLSYDEMSTCYSFIKAIEQFSGRMCLTIDDYGLILGQKKINGWICDVFWIARTYLMQRCLRYALRSGMKYPTVISKMRYGFFGYPCNKILYYDEYVTMSKMVEIAINFGDIFGGDFEQYDTSYDEFMNKTLEIPLGVMTGIRDEYEESYEKFKEFSALMKEFTKEKFSNLLDEISSDGKTNKDIQNV